MKKLLVIALGLVLVLGLASCGSGSSSKADVIDTTYADYNLDDYIKVKDYKGLEVQPYVINVSRDEIDSAVKLELDNNKETTEVKEGTELKDGDTANIDYVGKIDGEAFDGGSSEGYDLTLGSGSFIDGFESGLVGKKVGETVDLNLTFPEDYGSADLAGKDAVFTVTINSAKRSKAITEEEYVKKSDKYDSVEAFEAAKEEALKKTKEQTALNEQYSSLWSTLMSQSEVIEYPTKEYDAYIKVYDQQIDDLATQYSMTREQVIEQMGCSGEEELATLEEDSCKQRIQQELLIQYIANEEGIEYTDEEVQTSMEQLQSSGYTEEIIESQSGRTLESYAIIELLYSKTSEVLLKNANITGSAKEY